MTGSHKYMLRLVFAASVLVSVDDRVQLSYLTLLFTPRQLTFHFQEAYVQVQLHPIPSSPTAPAGILEGAFIWPISPTLWSTLPAEPG